MNMVASCDALNRSSLAYVVGFQNKKCSVYGKKLSLSFLLLQLWRVSESKFQFRTSQGQFLTCDGEGCSVSATAESPSTSETFFIERNNSKVHFKLKSGAYLQV
jgi:hypothetical protein